MRYLWCIGRRSRGKRGLSHVKGPAILCALSDRWPWGDGIKPSFLKQNEDDAYAVAVEVVSIVLLNWTKRANIITPKTMAKMPTSMSIDEAPVKKSTMASTTDAMPPITIVQSWEKLPCVAKTEASSRIPMIRAQKVITFSNDIVENMARRPNTIPTRPSRNTIYQRLLPARSSSAMPAATTQ